jgi:Ulp1 family protease
MLAFINTFYQDVGSLFSIPKVAFLANSVDLESEKHDSKSNHIFFFTACFSDLKNPVITCYDSLNTGSMDKHYMKAMGDIAEFLYYLWQVEQGSMDRGSMKPTSEWKYQFAVIPRQENIIDCGVFAMW